MLILVRPHVSLLDGPAVARFLPKAGIYQAVFAVDPDYAQHPVWSRLLNAYGWLTGGHTMLPLDATRPFAMRDLLRLLNQGRDVVIFPQGTGIGAPIVRTPGVMTGCWRKPAGASWRLRYPTRPAGRASSVLMNCFRTGCYVFRYLSRRTAFYPTVIRRDLENGFS